MARKRTELRRYTNALTLVDLLQNRRLSLLNPDTWYDQNDAFGLREYARLKGGGTAFAMCFAQGAEQANHWQIFSGDNHGVCVLFDKKSLLNQFDEQAKSKNLTHRRVIYSNIKEIKQRENLLIEDVPFLKRSCFRTEREYRVVVWQEDLANQKKLDIPISLSCISRIVFGPKMPLSLAQSLREVCRSIDGCKDINFRKSRLDNNEAWASAVAEKIQASGIGHN